MTYTFRYRQSVTEGGSTVQQGGLIPVSESVWNLSPLNEPWVNAGCYAGAIPANGSEIGSYSIAMWSGWNKDSVYSDMRDLNIRSYVGSSQQNLRFMAKYNNGSFSVNKQSFNWTNLREPTVTAIRDAIPNRYELSNYSEYDPYKRQNKSLATSGNSNSPLNVAPLEELHINDLIWLPIFKFNEVEYYNFDDVAEGYANVTYGSSVSYYWGDIKPEDKTPAGEHYDADLFEKGWTEIEPVHEGGRRFRYCCGVYLTPYYGKSSNSYNPTTDTYNAGTNPDDGKVYGDRQVFGSVASEFDEYPVIGTTTNLNRPCLLVMTESYDSVTGGLVYSLPAGISFSNILVTGSVSGNVHALQPSWSIASDFHTFAATTSWTSEFFIGNQDYCNFYQDSDPASNQAEPSLSITSCVINADIQIAGLYNIPDLSSATRLYLVDNTPLAYAFQKSNRNLTATNLAFYPVNSLWHTIASLGCYVADYTTTAQKAPTGYYTGNNNHMYLGHMDASGITDGIMLQGGEIPASVQAGIDDIIQNTPYTPIKPTPPTPSDTDPTNPPVPSGKAEPKITGDDVKGRQDRAFHASSNSYYELSDAELKSFIDVLWSQPQSFYEAIQIAGKQTASIFDYITSLRVYPFDASLFPTSGSSPIFMGTGATLKKTDGTEYTLSKLSEYINYTNFCSFHLAEFKDWRNNFLDYSPYTKVSLYLPYAGTIDLDCQMISAFSDITGCTIDVDFSIDLQSGVLTYYVFADNAYLLATQNVKVGVDIPLNGNDSLQQSINMVRNTYSNATRLLSGASSIALNAMSGNGAGAVAEALTAPVGIAEMALNTSLASRQIPVNTMPTSGSISSMIAGQDPFITIYRQKIANPANYGHAIGYKTESTHSIDSLSGWTVCRNPDLSGISATEGEKRLIADILTTGFYA